MICSSMNRFLAAGASAIGLTSGLDSQYAYRITGIQWDYIAGASIHDFCLKGVRSFTGTGSPFWHVCRYFKIQPST